MFDYDEEEKEDDLEVLSESEDKENEEVPEMQDMRPFKVPTINFNAGSYVDMIDWTSTRAIFEPPLTKHLTNDELQKCIDVPLEVPFYPCHTQAVERAVKMVTEASASVIGEEERDGLIRQKVKSRSIIPKIESKKDALPLLNNI